MTDVTDFGLMEVAKSIIVQAADDYRETGDDAVKLFFYSEWFEDLAELTGLNPVEARVAVETNQLVKAVIKRGKLCLQ